MVPKTSVGVVLHSYSLLYYRTYNKYAISNRGNLTVLGYGRRAIFKIPIDVRGLPTIMHDLLLANARNSFADAGALAGRGVTI